MDDFILTSDLFSSNFYFTGSVEEFPEDPECGNIVVKEGNNYVWTGQSWELFGYTEKEVEAKPEAKPKICIRCGAPMHGNKCEYCKTEYTWW